MKQVQSADAWNKGVEAWGRFLAKYADALVVTAAYALVVTATRAAGLTWFDDVRESIAAMDSLLGWAAPFIAWLVVLGVYDWLWLTLIGATPGRMLLGLKVQRVGGDGRPGAGQAAGRTALMLVAGLGLGIPIICPFALIVGYFSLHSKGVTVWDWSSGLKVVLSPVGQWRWVLIAILATAHLGLLLVQRVLALAASG
ncbi:hypothetical protein QO010_001844 [Caulobacter ginsengisoli]|uniref:RDD domain-containing protein n=1 Tax=Caulobacter ginsengisoli TaxID=400775 RepID=A0ABU0IPY3_9CAUL|nr:RDD family protein [Caulobacter ginsengisoli]MDQ0464073.1 hypothetical protein [Caulobacter ginsengisoli]